MDNSTTNIPLLMSRWNALLRQMTPQFGEQPDLQGIIFLIGVQELGKGYLKFSKDEKQDLMHIATCRLLSYFGYYILEGHDKDGWPHWKQEKEIPKMSLKEQDLLLKEATLNYFSETGIFIEGQETKDE
jgi:hypothetical protein